MMLSVSLLPESSFDKCMENQGASSMRDNVKIPLENYPGLIKQVQDRVLLNLIKNNVNVVACRQGHFFVVPLLHQKRTLPLLL